MNNFEKLLENRVNVLIKTSIVDLESSKKKIESLIFDDEMKVFLTSLQLGTKYPKTLASNQKSIDLDYDKLGNNFFEELVLKKRKTLLKNGTLSYFAFDTTNQIAVVGVLDTSAIDKQVAEAKEEITSDYYSRIKIRVISIFLVGIALMLAVYLVARKISQNIQVFKDQIGKDAIDLKEKNRVLTEMLYTDILTKLPNKKALQRDIKNMKSPKLIVFDLDSFKDISEYYGDQAEDYLLLYFRDYLYSFVKDSAMEIYRIGVDEFAILEDEALDIEKYEGLISELLADLKSKEIEVPNIESPIELNATIGFCLETEDILTKAMMALNYAKDKQRDYACYMRSIDNKDRYAEQVKWSNLIKEAIEKDQVIPYFQGIFDKSGNVNKYECLVRIVNDEKKVISPGLFLETSKNVRQYPRLTKVLITKAFEIISQTDKMVSINMLARDMSDSDVSNFIIDKIREYDIAKQVVLEILEDENIEHIDRIGSYLQRARRMGIKIAIDDFGTGYSNFSYLLKLKPDYIKIDGSLIKNIDTDENSIAIVSSILTFAKRLEIKTIAEFIHSKEVYDKCIELGIDEFQGFYLAEPSSDLLSKN